MQNDAIQSRRSFLKDAMNKTTLGVLVLASCRNNSKDNRGNKGIISYLKTVYDSTDPKEIHEGLYSSEVKRHGKIITGYLPFVDLKNPTNQDKAFICTVKDWDPIVDYLTINPNKLTEEDKQTLNEYNSYIKDSSSHKLDKLDREFIGQMPWLNPDNLTNKDKIWLIYTASSIPSGV